MISGAALRPITRKRSYRTRVLVDELRHRETSRMNQQCRPAVIRDSGVLPLLYDLECRCQFAIALSLPLYG